MPSPNNNTETPKKHRQLRHHFIAAWIRSPLKIGAALPSSRTLARAMAAQVDIEHEGKIIEIGAGTGVVTQALIEADIPNDRLIIIERDKQLYSILHTVFHNLKILCADAMDLENILKDNEITKVNAIVSSLPFLSMPVAIRHGIQEQMAKSIGDNGIIIQFTYGHKSPINKSELRRYSLTGKRVKLVIANIPPAHVWVYKRNT